MKQLIAIFFLLVAACAPQSSDNIFSIGKVSDGPLVVQVNDIKIHQGLLDTLSELNPRLKSQLANPLTRRKILTSLVEQQLLFQEAVKQGIHNDEDVTIKHLLNKHVIISNSLVEKELNNAMQKEYDSKKDAQFTKVRVSLIAKYFNSPAAKDKKKSAKATKPTDAQKKASLASITKIKSRLKKGDDFSKIAKEESDDKSSARKGGDAGQISKIDKRFERRGLQDVVKAAFKLKKDQVSDPIETPKGYYLVKVTSDTNVVKFEDAKRTLGFELQNKIKKTLLEKLKKDAKIVWATDTKKEKKQDKPNNIKKLNLKKGTAVPKDPKQSHKGHDHK
jgi:parvulin-like peptidyl-prolyl isomerase